MLQYLRYQRYIFAIAFIASWLIAPVKINASGSDSGLYDESVLRTINIEFSQQDWWDQLTANYVSDIDIPADLTVDGVTYPGVGVRFRGWTSYQMTGNSQKKSFNISIDYQNPDQRLMGYKTLNLNNCYEDPSFMREVLYCNISRNYIPCPKANFVKLTINGENWGIYANVQQINGDMIEEWFSGNDGDRWKVNLDGSVNGGMPGNNTGSGDIPGGDLIPAPGDSMPANGEIPGGRPIPVPGDSMPANGEIPGGRPIPVPGDSNPVGGDIPGGGPIPAPGDSIPFNGEMPGGGLIPDITGGIPGNGNQFSSGIGALSWLGNDITAYQEAFELKTDNTPDPWKNLINTCYILNNTPLEYLEDSLSTVLAVDMSLWFLTVENIFTDDDSYLTKGSDYQVYYDVETGLINPLTYDANSTFRLNSVQLDPFEGEDNANRPLINRLLSVPALRQRYLAHYRVVIDEQMDWSVISPKIEAYRMLIEDEVQADQKKIYTYDEFKNSLNDLENFITERRAYLLNYPGINVQVPIVSEVDIQTTSRENELQALTVTATVSSSTGIGKVILYCSKNGSGRFTKIEMSDNGYKGDGVVGDGVFSAIIPSSYLSSTLEYYIEARSTDTEETSSFAPSHAEQNLFTYEVEIVVTDSASVVINEFCADNDNVVADQDGDYDDWVELYNTSDKDIELGGYYLSDNQSDQTKWQLPDTVIAAKGFLIVWLDDDEQQSGLHANFKLSASGEEILLVAPSLSIIDLVVFEEQETDQSTGCYPDGTGEMIKMTPSFATSNLPGSSSGGETSRRDFNGDGIVNIADVVALILKSKDDPDDPQLDFNGNGRYEINDAISLVLYIRQLPSGVEVAANLSSEKIQITSAQKTYLAAVIEQLDLTEEELEIVKEITGFQEIPKTFSLVQNYPNPFNPSTTICFTIPEGEPVQVQLDIYDVRGRLIKRLIEGIQESGNYSSYWNGQDSKGNPVASGVYFYRLKAGCQIVTRKMVLIK